MRVRGMWALESKAKGHKLYHLFQWAQIHHALCVFYQLQVSNLVFKVQSKKAMSAGRSSISYSHGFRLHH